MSFTHMCMHAFDSQDRDICFVYTPSVRLTLTHKYTSSGMPSSKEMAPLAVPSLMQKRGRSTAICNVLVLLIVVWLESGQVWQLTSTLPLLLPDGPSACYWTTRAFLPLACSTNLWVHPVLEHVEQNLHVPLGLHEPAHVAEGRKQIAGGFQRCQAGDNGVVGPVVEKGGV